MLVLFLLPIAAVIAEEVIVCLPGIKTFAADASYGDRSYWQCGADGKATLKTCPEGQLYHRRSGRCRTVAKTHPGLLKRATGTSPDLEVLELENTNSNSETLGAIYNARTGRFVTGRNLWGAEVTDANMISQPLVYSNLETYQEQDIDDRVYHLGVKANMALSLLSGMIAVSGTAEYLRNEQVKSEAAAVVMKYTSTRVSETMPLTTPITHKGICEMAAEEGGPTHVVSSLTRGLRAFLKFKKSLSLVDSKEDIGGRLAISINSIPGFAFNGSAWVNINGTEVKNLVGVTVTYYGDATISNPTSYLAAVQAFEDIQAKAPTSSKTVRYQLVPLSYLCTSDVKQLKEIQDNLVVTASQTLVELDKIKEKTEILRNSLASQTVSTIKAVLTTFSNKLQAFTDDYKASIREQLLLLSSGSSEIALIKLIHGYQSSAFSYNKASLFLEVRSREISTINLVLAMVRDRKTFAISSSNDDISYLYKYKYAVFFVLNILPEDNIADRFIETKEVPDESGAWYNSPASVGLVGNRLRQFIAFAKTNKKSRKHGFIVSIKKMKNGKQSVYSKFYRPEVDLEEMELPFPPPSSPPTPVCSPRFEGFNLDTAATTNPNVTLHYVKAQRYENKNEQTTIVDKQNPSTKDVISIRGLKPASEYNISTAYKVFDIDTFPDAGTSPWTSLVSCWTAPSTLLDVAVTKITYNSFTVSIGKPEKMVEGPLKYKVIVTKDGTEDILHYSRDSPGNLVIGGLAPATLYHISAWTEKGRSRSAVTTIKFATSLSHIPFPEVYKVTQTEVQLIARLSLLDLAPGLIPTSLTAFVHQLNSRGQVISGTEFVDKTVIKSGDAGRDVIAKISNVKPGKTYAIVLQLTTEYDGVPLKSDKSDEVQVTTPLGGSEADKVKEEIDIVKEDVADRINAIERDVKKEGAAINNIDLSGLDSVTEFEAFDTELSRNLTIQSSILQASLRRSCIAEGQLFFQSDAVKTPGSSIFDCSSKCTARKGSCESATYDSMRKVCLLNSKRRGQIVQAKSFQTSINNVCNAVVSGIPRNWDKCMIKNKAYSPKVVQKVWGITSMYDCVMACINSSNGCTRVTWDSTSQKSCDLIETANSGMSSKTGAFSATLACLSA